MNVRELCNAIPTSFIDMQLHLEGLGLRKVGYATEVEPLFAEAVINSLKSPNAPAGMLQRISKARRLMCVITSLKPLDITKPSTPRIIRWFTGRP